MAMNVGNLSAHRLQCSFRPGAALNSYPLPQIMSVSPFAENRIHLVPNSTGRFLSAKSLLLGFKNSSSFKVSKFIVAVHAKTNGRTPSQDTGNIALINPETVSTPASISQVTPDSGKNENMVKKSVPLHQLRQGEFLENHLLYRQKFVIRSYEVGADKATSITTIFSFFQEVSLCHVHLMGIAGDGFGATKAMNLLGLIWVVAKMHVEVEEFPKWPDVIEIDSWIARAGKNGMRRDWVVRRYETNEVLIRATSTWCMMDSNTRRVCKMPDAARAELDPFFLDDRFVFQQKDILSNRIPKLDNVTAKYFSPPLKSSRADLDVNQHVSNLKYISWTLQSVPEEHLETHDLTSITIEYRRECQSKNVVESITSSKKMLEECAASVPAEGFWSFFVDSGLPCSEFTHLLRTQDSAQHEIVRARTSWRPKPSSASSRMAEHKI
ncbi:hypothetical protein KC19_3G077100 [Ceratodon purpureus]|uniref:Acyl-[acyl-carrier-protein] hydrolase n=1 Tax=Ceratodon purpureus TaxID=3225 RepID=A0A8T0IIF8_CERPU|nr:hypothetical protein KC19_3G077100 [Ceratodon purpureus]KAG0582681.1 hypothetical protein KC19_3G077100 [Ceratodon purpureus]